MGGVRRPFYSWARGQGSPSRLIAAPNKGGSAANICLDRRTAEVGRGPAEAPVATSEYSPRLVRLVVTQLLGCWWLSHQISRIDLERGSQLANDSEPQSFAVLAIVNARDMHAG